MGRSLANRTEGIERLIRGAALIGCKGRLVPLVFAAALCLLIAVSGASAQDALRFVGKTLSEKDLPFTGYPLTVSMELEGTRNVSQRLHAVLVRDGRLTSVTLPEGYLNEFDRPQFDVEIPAPETVLSYQFVLEREDGSLLFSDRYSVARACLPDTTPYRPDRGDQGDEQVRLRELVWSSKKLEHLLVMYGQIEKLLAKINELG